MTPFQILYEDYEIIVCEKPHGVPTQSKRLGSPDMVSLLKNHIARENAGNGNSDSRRKSIGREPYLAVIHRLDQPVRGILVFARTAAAAKELNRQLQTRGFGKYYRALVTGTPEPTENTLENYMVKDARTNISRICAKDTKDAKLARLHYRTIDPAHRFFPAPPDTKSGTISGAAPDAKSGTISSAAPDAKSGTISSAAPDAPAAYTELEIQLDTGRHHQIRCQLAHIGCPIAGDTKYNPAARDVSGWQNICLCAFRLEFDHPVTHRHMKFELAH